MGKGRAKTGPYASARGKARESDGAMLKRELIGQSIDYLLRHLDEGVTIKAVADHFHYSESYFSRVFKAVTGVSVYAFFKHLKLDQSAIDIKLKYHRANRHRVGLRLQLLQLQLRIQPASRPFPRCISEIGGSGKHSEPFLPGNGRLLRSLRGLRQQNTDRRAAGHASRL